MFLRWPFGHIEADLGDNGLNRQNIKAVNGYQIHTDHTVKRVSQIEGRLVSLGFFPSVLVFGKGFVVRIDFAFKAPHTGLDLSVTLNDLLRKDFVEFKLPTKGKEVLLSPVALKGFSNCLVSAFHTRVLELGQFDRIALPIKNRLDDLRARYTGDIGDRLVELDVHLLQGLLHPLDMRPNTLD